MLLYLLARCVWVMCVIKQTVRGTSRSLVSGNCCDTSKTNYSREANQEEVTPREEQGQWVTERGDQSTNVSSSPFGGFISSSSRDRCSFPSSYLPMSHVTFLCKMQIHCRLERGNRENPAIATSLWVKELFDIDIGRQRQLFLETKGSWGDEAKVGDLTELVNTWTIGWTKRKLRSFSYFHALMTWTKESEIMSIINWFLFYNV
jgi:hypothetical protein